MKTKTILIFAGLLGVISVSMGAMGAHALKAMISEESLTSFLTGSRYNMYHALVLLALVPLREHLSPKWHSIGSFCMVIGTLLFSGSIYLLSTSEITGLQLNSLLGPITPIGGLILITGWASIVIGAIKGKE